MRTLKFRFWDVTLKKMCFRNPLTYDFCTDSIIPLQFTGFTDKHGKNIYEGDILSDWNVVDGEMTQSFMQVFWCEKEGAWKLDASFKQNKSSGDLLSEELEGFVYEITGNIYENPNLLNQER